MVAETFGGWHSAAQREVKKLGAALARHTGQEEGEAISHLWSRMGILLQRGNAAILGNRVLSQPGAHIEGIIQIVTFSKVLIKCTSLHCLSPIINVCLPQ